MNILMVASEATPFAKTGGLADVLGALPLALAERGEQVAVVLPAYRENRYPRPTREAYRSLWIPIGPGYRVDIQQITLQQTDDRSVTYYFVQCPALYDRDGIYGTAAGDFPDNHLRFAVLSMAAIGVARHLFRPDVLHLHDWQAALAPVYLREHFWGDPTFMGVKTLLTIHNLGYQGLFPPEALPEIALDPRLMNPDQIEFFGRVNFLKAGIAFSDAVSTVSKGYASEIQTPEYGFGLDGFLRRHGPITGILNGVDYNEWNPEHDPHIARDYSLSDLSGKRACKQALLAEYSLPQDNLDRPLLAIISRFAAQKGFDILADAASRLMQEDLNLVVLGSGDLPYESMFRALAGTYPSRVGLHVGYDTGLSHRIEAGADMFLMPSRYEPCGLNQIYSLKYGTVPVVRATGGLDDTIDEGTGFKFRDYSGDALLDTVRMALKAYQDLDSWVRRMRRGMEKDFSWKVSAGEYVDLYRRLVAS
ncbi:MAG TPA: glycogen synthase GlgA [Bryobacteraceae bacterium]|nr:glycogen synthase GlgA [Bryobacteraceae bacterium]